MSPPSPIAVELAFFESNRAKWVAEGRTGQWALAKGAELICFHATFEAAFNDGASRFGASSFLVKQVRAADPVETIHRSHLGAVAAR